MDETKRNSMKLDIEAVRVSENDHDQPTETYKQVSEFSSNEKSTGNMTREKSDTVEDGADERMLDGDEKQQLARKDEVKFIASDRSNGDAKIDIGNIEKNFTGMTKEELMKYANDPFWQRLRWIFFILFWLLWAAMLAGAIYIILKAPKCSVAKPLPWYKEGPLFAMPNYEIKVDATLIEKLKAIETKGVIYRLPDDFTYKLNETKVQNFTKKALDDFKNTGIKVIFDLTPNYVMKDGDLFQQAKDNDTLRGAFIWKNTNRIPNNWQSIVPNENTNHAAWLKIQPDTYVLSQFGPDKIDLQLNNSIAKENFKNVLRQIAQMGVKGFRLANAKHYIINPEAPDEISISKNAGGIHTDYSFWAHTYSTNLAGIGDLLHEFSQVVQNETNGDGFLSITDIIDRPDVFKTKNDFGFELPILTNLSAVYQSSGTKPVAYRLYQKLKQYENSKIWQQWSARKLSASNSLAYNTFLFLLPGVPVGSIQDLITTDNATINQIKELEKLRKQPSYQHGNFTCFLGHNDTVIAYTRLKLGVPGYFVVYNPTDAAVTVNFQNVTSLPESLTKLELANASHKENTAQVPTNAIPLAANSAVIFRYASKTS